MEETVPQFLSFPSTVTPLTVEVPPPLKENIKKNKDIKQKIRQFCIKTQFLPSPQRQNGEQSEQS
ncbi:hypothetical protein [Streptococcus penaeicida]|uniref:hypothetical protein n=1 Tax=Streptococcus penaeicida TaxID=1765960 RepID=UPI00101AE8D6|nr:hypothetical protein [Streptococcus penaeicida]